MVGGCAVPVFTLATVDRLFPRQADWGPTILRLYPITAVVGVTAAVVHLAFYRHMSRSSPAEIASGVFTFSAFGLTLWRLWAAQAEAPLQIDRTRIRYVLALAAGAVLTTLLEQSFRILIPAADPHSASIPSLNFK